MNDMKSKLGIDFNQVEHARSVARKIADGVQDFVEGYTTVAVERTLCRLIGIDGVDANAVPLPNVVVEELREKNVLGEGALFFLGNAIVETGLTPQQIAEQIAAGATYLDVNIGPAESNGPELMTWAVKLLQENFNNVPLALDTANKRAIEAGIKVYNRTNGKPIVNSADAGSRISYIDLAAANDAICIALCSADGIAKDNDERMMHCHHMLERGMSLGMEATDLWFDPLFLVVKGMQDKQMDVLNAIKLFADEGLKSTGGLSNNSNGAPKNVRPIMDSALVAMAMMQGLTSAIVNPNDLRLMETIKSCDIFKNNELYSDSYLDA